MTRPNWYLKNVKDIERHNWSTREMGLIYTLKKTHNLPAIRVAKSFDISVVQVYNVTRLVTRAYRRECFMCGKKLSETDLEKNKGKFIKACIECKNKSMIYKRERRKVALKKGLCGYCERAKVIPGHTSCKKCISATYRRRYNKDLCGRCGKYPITSGSTTLCQRCTEENRKRSQIHKKKNKTKA